MSQFGASEPGPFRSGAMWRNFSNNFKYLKFYGGGDARPAATACRKFNVRGATLPVQPAVAPAPGVVRPIDASAIEAAQPARRAALRRPVDFEIDGMFSAAILLAKIMRSIFACASLISTLVWLSFESLFFGNLLCEGDACERWNCVRIEDFSGGESGEKDASRWARRKFVTACRTASTDGGECFG